MSHFLGEFDCKLDAKGRMMIPAGLKKQLPDAEREGLVINRGFEKCLSLYPMQSWQPLYDQISTLNDFDPKIREFKRYFFNGATEVELDSAGRLLIPPNLKDHANISKDIVLVGSYKKIEIWDSKKYKEFFDSMTPQRFSELAAEVVPPGIDL